MTAMLISLRGNKIISYLTLYFILNHENGDYKGYTDFKIKYMNNQNKR